MKSIFRRTGLWALAGFMCGVAAGALAFGDGAGERPWSQAAKREGDRGAGPAAGTAERPVEAGRSDPAGARPASGQAAEQEAPVVADSIDGEGEEGASRKSPEPAPDEEPEPAIRKGISDVLRQAVEADPWFRSARLRMHEAVGTGALVGLNGPTAAGRALLERLGSLPDHGLDAAPYDVAASRKALAALPAGEAEAARVEAMLGKALLRLVLDFRFLKKAGPFKLVTEKDLEDDAGAQRKASKLAAAFVEAAATGGEPAARAADEVIHPRHPLFAPLLLAHTRYRRLAEAGGCPKVPVQRLRAGAKGDAVVALQKRLACEGYYDPVGEPDGVFDEDVRLALAKYQRHHELEDEGLLLEQTIRSLNVPLGERRDQIAVALQRVRESRVPELGDFYLHINLPLFELRAFEHGKVVKRHKVIVGTNRLDDDKLELVQGHLNRTKLFVSRLYEVIINPSWILPERVAKGELVGKVQDDPEYLEKQNINKKVLPDGREVLVQGRGKGNVLGKVKFLLERTNAIYLHDTDKPWLFRQRRRDFSHGCIRVHEAVDFARWLLAKDGFDKDDIERGLGLKGTQRGMRLRNAVPIVTEYIIVDVSEEGLPIFLTDIYGYDKAYKEGRLPPLVQLRWGHVQMRPHWVPLTPKETVDQWRAEGKPAPRDHIPKKK